MDVKTVIPTQFALNEAMRRLTLNTVLAICEQNHLSPADLQRLAHQLAQREANADAKTGVLHVCNSSRNRH
ncbi:hypothetical protein CBF16_14545 [Pantoea agglomerans]|uniref:hypothetical protein n=1 Tax=Enterobacter agglomerans TaxID=549 RepID=UPI000F5DE18D|nr:hypothetical protein [Pantoea agglomerans]AZI52012.1 hypothetical protein CBF16_14545 [Pantoea agglomerans]